MKRMYLFAGLLAAGGCGPEARLRVQQPQYAPRPQQRLELTTHTAFFAEGLDEPQRLYAAFPLPGGWAGRKVFVLYLRTPPGPGRKTIGPVDDIPSPATGFFIQISGPGRGLTRVIDGTVVVEAVGLGSRDQRRARVDLACQDGTAISGTMRLQRDALEVELFEERYAPDVRRLLAGSAGTQPTASRPAGPTP